MPNPKVTVTMPAYNASKYINEAIKSVLNQNYESFELLILDDGSTDNTWDVIQKYKKDPRVRIYRNKKNTGVAKTRNRLIRLAKGCYISICDADDLMLPGNLKTLSQYLDNHPRTGAVYGNILILNIDNKNRLIKHPYIAKSDCAIKWDLLEKESLISHSGSMVRKREIFKIGGYDKTLIYLDDLSLWFRLSENTRIKHLRYGIYYIWRRHPSSLTRVAGQDLRYTKKMRVINKERLLIKEKAIRRRYGFNFKYT